MSIKEEHWTDENGNPAGGTTFGNGFAIGWQHGPLGRGEDRREPNGAFVEDVLFAAAGRLTFYQESKFKCQANEDALRHIATALQFLVNRTKDREERNVEGIHKL